MQPVLRLATCSELFAEGPELFAEHWDEVARHKGIMRLSPDVDRYHTLEQAGALLAIGAWQGPELIGYSVGFVTTHLHYSELLYYQNDVLFVPRTRRGARMGRSLVHMTEVEAKARGCRMVTWHAKQGTALDRCLPRWGYGVQDVIYSKEI